MGITSASHNEDADRGPGVATGGEAPVDAATRATSLEAPTRQLVTAQVGERCITCEAPLASDQRYCLNCGERRGKSGFDAGGDRRAAQPTAPAAGRQAERSPRRRRTTPGRRWSPGSRRCCSRWASACRSAGSTTATTRAGAPRAPARRRVQVVTVGSGGGGGTAPAPRPRPRQGKSKGKATRRRTAARPW